jgi:hypothetical protein
MKYIHTHGNVLDLITLLVTLDVAHRVCRLQKVNRLARIEWRDNA